MRNVAGAPGTWTGFSLRAVQFVFASASIASVASTSSFFNYTVFCYFLASMGLQLIWSSGLSFMDAYTLLKKTVVVHNPVLVGLIAIGDWVTATLTLAAAASSAGVVVLYFGDLGGCSLKEECTKYEIGVAFAFLAWILINISSLVMIWLLAED